MTSATFTLPGFATSTCATPLVVNPAYNPSMIQATDDLLTLSHTEEGLALYEYARRSRGSILEIGTYCGHTALFLAYGIRNRPIDAQQGAEVFAMDTFDGFDQRDADASDMQALHSRSKPTTFPRFVRACKEHRVWDIMHPIIDDSAHAHALWNHGNNLGLLFIDGDHRRAMDDFSAYARFLREDAYICFHDYWPELPFVMRDVDLLVKRHRIIPVERIHTLFIAKLAPR